MKKTIYNGPRNECYEIMIQEGTPKNMDFDIKYFDEKMTIDLIGDKKAIGDLEKKFNQQKARIDLLGGVGKIASERGETLSGEPLDN